MKPEVHVPRAGVRPGARHRAPCECQPVAEALVVRYRRALERIGRTLRTRGPANLEVCTHHLIALAHCPPDCPTRIAVEALRELP